VGTETPIGPPVVAVVLELTVDKTVNGPPLVLHWIRHCVSLVELSFQLRLIAALDPPLLSRVVAKQPDGAAGTAAWAAWNVAETANKTHPKICEMMKREFMTMMLASGVSSTQPACQAG
jgi:hypothetical protein